MVVKMECQAAGGGKKIYDSTGTPSSSRIECGFKPRIIMIYVSSYNSSYLACHYNADIYEDKYELIYNNQAYGWRDIASDQQIYNIDDTGFNLPFYNLYSGSVQIVATE